MKLIVSQTIRLFCCVVIAGLAKGCDSRPDAPAPEIPHTSNAIASGDYADFRSRFQTRLVRKAASPQRSEPFDLPPGTSWLPYKSGGLELKSIMGLPPGTKEKTPAVVFLHGGFAFGDGDWDMAKPFLDAGFIAMTPLLRGENHQPGTFSLYYDEVNDVLAATEELMKHPLVDSDRVYIAGHSAGGTLCVLASMAAPRAIEFFRSKL